MSRLSMCFKKMKGLFILLIFAIPSLSLADGVCPAPGNEINPKHGWEYIGTDYRFIGYAANFSQSLEMRVAFCKAQGLPSCQWFSTRSPNYPQWKGLYKKQKGWNLIVYPDPDYGKAVVDTDCDDYSDAVDICVADAVGTQVDKFGCHPDGNSDGDVDFGPPSCEDNPIYPQKGNPITILNGNKYESIEDLRFNSPFTRQFVFIRYYNSQSSVSGTLGYGWTHSYSARLIPNYDANTAFIKILEETGRGVYFLCQGEDTRFLGRFMERSWVNKMGDHYVWMREDNLQYTFDATGRLIRIEDKTGNRQLLAYDATGRLETVTDLASGRILNFHYRSDGFLGHISGPSTAAVPDGIWVMFDYANHNLMTATYADGSGFNYFYEDPHDPHNLTLKTNKLNHILSSWSYDHQDRVVNNITRDGRGVSVNYDGENIIEVTDAYGSRQTYTVGFVSSRKRITATTGALGCNACGERVVRVEYNDNLDITEIEYANGRIDMFADFDSRGNPQTVILAAGSVEERIVRRTFDENSQSQVKRKLSQTEISVLDDGSHSRLKVTIWDHDDDSNGDPNENPTSLLKRFMKKGFTQDEIGNDVAYEHITTYQHNAKGQLIRIDGPISGNDDVTSFSYDPFSGDLLTISRPALGTISFSDYDAAGNPGAMTDANGTRTNYVYDGKNRVISSNTDGFTTSWTYNLAGDLSATTDGAGRTMHFHYDSTYGRLERITDSLGNTLRYEYDLQGNRIEEAIYTAENIRVKYLQFDYQNPQSPGHLWKVINPDDTVTFFEYDSMGNRSGVIDALAKSTIYDYDNFDRLSRIVHSDNTVTSFGYDTQHNLTFVTDAESLTTTYRYDDLGRMLREDSPDTGTTRYLYDTGGNLIRKLDANNKVVSYTYDTANRLTAVRFADASQDIFYSYDEGENGIGKLTGMDDASGTTVYTYNRFGRLVNEIRTIAGHAYNTQYQYDSAGLLSEIIYPDGLMVNYERDIAGLVRRVTTTSAEDSRTLVDAVEYLPFGPIFKMTTGNSMVQSIEFDSQYRVIHNSVTGHQNLYYAYDGVGNITTINDQLESNRTQRFEYDDLYRLTSASGIYGQIGFSYDKVGNRMSKNVNSLNQTYGYENGSHRLTEISGAVVESFGYDAIGNTTNMGNQVFAYNGSNRLATVFTNGSTVAQYTYNGIGQRILKTTGGNTTVYHYDQSGNLISESDQFGRILKNYIYLGNKRVAVVANDKPTAIAVSVSTNSGRFLSGIRVYAFSESGQYTGRFAITDDDGIARFDFADLSEGNYTFRADYLSCQFWSEAIAVPDVSTSAIIVTETHVTVKVIQAGKPQESVRVYLFSERGSYLGIYLTTDENGQVIFDLPEGFSYKFRADILGSRFFSDVITVTDAVTNYISIESGGGKLELRVDKGILQPIVDIPVYLFSEKGFYLGRSDQTDVQGLSAFDVPSGTYKIRADYLGYQYWTGPLVVTTDTTSQLTINHKDTVIFVEGDVGDDLQPRRGISVYLFSASGVYQGIRHSTNEEGQVVFNLPDREYKVRADYLGQQFWSVPFIQTDQIVTVPECRVEVTVNRLSNPLDGVSVYVFSEKGSYLGLKSVTDMEGKVEFRVPAGVYNFRADCLGNRYFSGNTELIAHQPNPVTVSTGGGNFTLRIEESPGTGLPGTACYLFSSTGSYLGHQTTANEMGEAVFELADGNYKVRIDYMGYQFWTPEFSIPETNSLIHLIEHQDVTVTVERDYSGSLEPIGGVKLYLFKPSGSYLGLNRTSDSDGQVIFRLPMQTYQVRADHLGQRFWSKEFIQNDQTINIQEGMAGITVSQGNILLENVSVYVFSTSDAYLGISGVTDAEGHVEFRLPDGTYKFRADHQGSRFWVTERVVAHQVKEVALSTGGGTFVLTVEKAQGIPIFDVPVYVFSQAGSYLGINARTDAQGQVFFDLSDGSYQFRVDYLGYRFWSDTVNIPDNLSDLLTIEHQDVTVTVNESYISTLTPLEDIKVYLFTAAGSHQRISADTDIHGRVTINLPLQEFKVRADYLGSRYWSEVFNSHDVEINIPHGQANVQVYRNGIDVFDAPVYLFSEAGSYLGRMERTNSAGQVQFIIPERSYKFRVDHDGNQYWSNVVNVLPNDDVEVILDLDLLASDETLNPKPTRCDGIPPAYTPRPIMLASLFDIYGILGKTTVSSISTSKIYYYINDHLGTPQKVVNENGTAVWEADYMPFGEVVINESSTLENNARFPGQHYDQETGLHYNYYRYYDPRIGRYLRPDPIGFEGGTNIYLYVLNNPVNFIDPLGLDWVYSQSTGLLTYIDSNGNITNMGAGYAGHGQGVNNPDMQNVQNVGPLPQGTYTIGPQQNNVTISGMILPGSMRLTPYPSNQMYGRGGFLIHGDNRERNQSASSGCPVFDRDVRDQIGISDDNVFRVVP